MLKDILNKMRLLIIGAGWYGCHLASICSTFSSVKLVDFQDIFSGSSSRNQNRLHLGFHYPRSINTIRECHEGYYNFLARYKNLIRNIDENYYFISEKSSATSYEDFLHIYQQEDIHFKEVDTDAVKPYKISSVGKQCIKTEEKYIDVEKCIEFFSKELEGLFECIPKFNTISEIVDYLSQDFDYIINCTYNHLNPIDFEAYEVFLILLYKIPYFEKERGNFAYTVMDGNYFSLYPYKPDEGIYSLTSVEHGVLWTGRDLHKINIDEQMIEERRKMIEDEVKSYLPGFNGEFRGAEISFKTKPKTQTDDRSIRLTSEICYNPSGYLTSTEDGNGIHVINVYGGKITGIFHAEKIIKSIINQE